MQSALTCGVAAPVSVCLRCRKQQQRSELQKVNRAPQFLSVHVERANFRCSAELATSEATFFSPAVHDSDVSGTTSTADTNTVTDSQAFATAMAKVADDTKAKDIMLLHVEPLSSWTSYMLLVTVSSRPQLGAALSKMEKEAELTWQRPRTHRSPGSGSWEVLDFGDVVIHVMSEDQRDYYDLEGFYGAAEEVELPFTTGMLTDTGLQWTQKL
ncbi:hypothetical protein ABBQ32_012763 [Trebouxia sp. C0010 RCD-2024]